MFKYEKIADELKKKIREGVYQPGEKLPREQELSRIYGSSRITIREAMDLLVYQGLIVKRRGSGSYVKNIGEGMQNQDLFSKSMQFSGFSKDMEGKEITSKIIEFSVIHPSEEVAEQLKISQKAFVYYICRIRLIENKPHVVEYTYMPIDIISGMTEDVLRGSIYEYIEKGLKLRIKSAHRTARALMPTEEEQDWLGMKEKILPVLEVEQTAYLDDGRIFEYSKSRHRGDLFELHSVSLH